MTYKEFLAAIDDSHRATTCKEHLDMICREAVRCRTILELGSHAGISTAAIALASPMAAVASVDLCDEVPEDERRALWVTLGCTNIAPVAGDAKQFLRHAAESGRQYDLVFHDAVHGDAVIDEYRLCAQIGRVVAIHDYEQLSGERRLEVSGLFRKSEASSDRRGRYLFMGWK